MRIKLFAIFIAIIIGVLFTTKAYGIVGAPTPSNNISQQLLVVFRPNQNPQQIAKAYEEKQKASKTFGGKLKTFLAEITGKTPGDTYYEKQIKAISEIEKKAQVVSSENLYTPKANESTTQLITLKKGADVKNAVKLYLTLPQVETAAPNEVKTIQSIQSDITDPYERAKTEIIVQYKEGTTPEEVAQEVNDRARIASQPVIGQLRIAANDTLNFLQGGQTPEQLQEEYAEVKQEAGVVASKDLITESKMPTPLENAQVVKVSNTSTTEAIDAFKSLPTVEIAVPNGVKTSVVTPNDPGFSQQWDMPKIQAPQAWDIAQGSNSVTVAVIDSGVDYNHQDLVANVIKGKNFMPGGDPNNPMDDCGHGTHVAGTIGAMTNNGIGVAGVNWNVKVLAVKALGPYGGSCAGNDSGIVQAIHSAADSGAKVINMSLGGSGGCGVYQEAITYARNAGVTVVVAAGNSNADASGFSPANCNGVIAVGATGPSDARASYSNYGSTVVIAAPGGDNPCATNCIYSTYPNNQYRMLAGTSMASPHVAGAAGLLLSKNSGLSPDEIKNLLISNADPISTDRPIGPRLNLLKAVQAVGGGGGDSPTPTPTSEPGATPTPTTPPGQDPTPTPTTPVAPQKGNFNISVNLPGIGPGENTNPNPSTKTARIEFLDRNGNVITTKNASLTFQNSSFNGAVPVNDVADGTYQLRVKLPGTLSRFIRGFYTVANNVGDVTLPTVSPSSGDINEDGILDILDYNILISAIQRGASNALADLNSDGAVTSADLNIFLRQLNNRVGD